jgi:tryptophan synthase alpha subunit
LKKQRKELKPKDYHFRKECRKMKKVNILITDLTPEARAEVEEIIGKDNNNDIIPLFTISTEE